MAEPAVFQITLPAAYAEGLSEALDAAAEETGIVEGFQLDEADPASSASEMQFDPITTVAGIYVANLVVQSVAQTVAGHFIASGLQKLIAKLKTDDPSGAPARRTALLMLPDQSVVSIDLNDPASVEAVLRRLTETPR